MAETNQDESKHGYNPFLEENVKTIKIDNRKTLVIRMILCRMKRPAYADVRIYVDDAPTKNGIRVHVSKLKTLLEALQHINGIASLYKFVRKDRM